MPDIDQMNKVRDNRITELAKLGIAGTPGGFCGAITLSATNARKLLALIRELRRDNARMSADALRRIDRI